MTLLSDLHAELALAGLVPETDPLVACSAYYRQQFEAAVTRGLGADPQDYGALVLELQALEYELAAQDESYIAANLTAAGATVIDPSTLKAS